MLKELVQQVRGGAGAVCVADAKTTRNVMRVSDVHLMTNCFDLLQGILGAGNTAESKLHSLHQLERVFLYALCWSLGSLLESDDRIKFSAKVSELSGGNLPSLAMTSDETLYDYFVNEETMEWEKWQAPEWEYKADTFNFSTCLVPTVDSSSAEYLIDTMLNKLHKPVLILGSTGTAKTSIILQYTNSFDNSKMLLKKVNFSSATTAGMFQVSMEADIEKRQGKTYAPPGGRLMTVFLDDISMPEVNTWGDQPTLELVRQLIETGAASTSCRRTSAVIRCRLRTWHTWPPCRIRVVGATTYQTGSSATSSCST